MQAPEGIMAVTVDHDIWNGQGLIPFVPQVVNPHLLRRRQRPLRPVLPFVSKTERSTEITSCAIRCSERDRIGSNSKTPS